ncbi:uncharacterized protein LOC123316758 [Coccinella septempunctata]|uniref:uncharacterized protein LOC123316758 n=1 Tax=Coccinella septempunctata TaxID=41139 RepID=UPI001D05E9F1|nr:uncharacterized protein LOC123316758 [Coccinella septempunctata]
MQNNSLLHLLSTLYKRHLVFKEITATHYSYHEAAYDHFYCLKRCLRSWKRMFFPILLLTFFASGHSVPSQDTKQSSPTVAAPFGKFQGALLENSFGKPIFSFRGIRYAEPPVKNLRFQPPVPIKKYEGLYDATKDGPACPQPNLEDPISEDCLFLNVYTTKLPDGKENPKRPVIIHFHAGGFYGVSSRSNWGGPQYFMNQEIVLVTLNYRLGALGFLSTGDKEAIGNNGLKDQVVAMKWVKENIEAFGGDPNSVTIFGYSAGAMSVSLHLVSPMSKGLFHKAVISSSSSLGNFALGYNQLDVAKRLAKILKCPDDTTANIVKCLKEKSAKELGDSLLPLFEVGYEPVLLYKPVIEKDFGQERFLTDHPIKLVQEGKFQNVPVMAGITAEEFGHKSIDTLQNPDTLKKLNDEWEKYAPVFFLYERYTDRSKTISKGLRSFYFADKKIDNSTQVQLSELYNEAQSGFAVNRAVKLLAEKNTQPVYYYRFSYKGRYSHYYLPGTNNTVTYGAVHHDDLIYLFYISALFPKFEKTDKDFQTVMKMTTLWSNFARTGKPIPETCGRVDFAEWEPYNSKTQKYLDIGETLKPKEKLYENRYAEWEKLFPLSQYDKVENIAYCMIRQVFLLVCIGLALARPDVKTVINNGMTPIVSSPLGQYQGTLMTTRLGKQIFSFKGIPYAQPPINELRFKPAVPVAKHEGVFNASEDGAACPQNTVDPISENCLLLNIYTTKLPKGTEQPKLPVIVYIHAGEFSSLSGRSNRAGPEYLLDQEVLLVTFNYRLGALGFLSTGDKEAPGNNGLKDQVLALKWLKENIEAFGGDSNSVTLYGYNAGAISAALHLMSPMSKGLFHKVIISSGSPLGQWPIEHNQMNMAKKLAKAVGCPDDNSANIIKCLKGKTANELGDSQSKLAEFGNEPLLTWKPVIEEDFGQERFLVEHPVNMVREGKFEKVPILTGLTSDEFAGRAVDIYKNADLLKQLDEHWEKNAPVVFMYERDTDHSKTISKALRSFYFGDKKFDNATLSHMTQLYADALSGFGVNRGVKLLAEKNTQPVYYYKFNYKGRYSHYYLPDSNGTVPYGVVHHDDLIYLFYVSANFPKFGESDTETPTVEKMTTMWANFARTGKPIPETNDKLDNAKWEPFNMKTQRYLEIGNKLTVAEKLFEKRYAEWEKLFPLTSYDKLKKNMG